MAKTFDLSILFKIIDRATGPLKAIGRKFKGLQTQMKAFGAQMSAIGKKMGEVGRNLTTKLTLPLLAIGAGAFKASMSFNEAMAEIATLIPGNEKRVLELKTAIQDMAKATGESTASIAEGTYQLISAFGDSEESMRKMDIATQVGIAGRASMRESIDLLSAVQLAYGDKTTGTTKKIADMAFEMVKMGKTTIPEMASSIGLVAPIAAQLNISLEEVFGTLGAMAGVTGTTSEAATQLGAVMVAFLKPTEKMKKLSVGLGYANAAQMFANLGLAKSLQLVEKYTKGDEQAMVELLGGRKEALKALFFLTKNEKRHAEMVDASAKSQGALNKAVKAATEGVAKHAREWRRFKQAIMVAAQRLGDQLAPMILKVTTYVEKFTDWFDKLNPETKQWIIYIGLAAAALGPLLMILGGAISMIGFMSTGLAVMGTTLGAVALAAGPVILAVGLLATAAALWVKNWKEIKTFFMDFWINLNFEVERFLELIQKIPVIGKHIGAPTGTKGYEDVAGMGPGIAAMGKAESETRIRIEVDAKSGTEATVKDVKKIKGDSEVEVTSEVGAGWYMGGMGG